MEGGVRPDRFRAEMPAALAKRRIQRAKRRKVTVHNSLIQQPPHTLGRLQLGALRRQEHQRHPVRHHQTFRAMPAGIVQHQYNMPRPTSPALAREQHPQLLEDRLVHPAAQLPDHLARVRLHEGRHVQPREAVVPQCQRARPSGRPHPPAHRLQPETVLVLGPDLDRTTGVGGRGTRPGLQVLEAEMLDDVHHDRPPGSEPSTQDKSFLSAPESRRVIHPDSV